MKINKELKAKINGKEIWVTSYNGHEIRVVNKAHVTMYIDGVEVAKQKGLIATQIILQSAIPNTDKVIIAHLYQKNSEDFFLTCDFIIGNYISTEYGFQHKDGSVSLLTDEELKQFLQYRKEEDELAVIITNVMSVL